MVFDARKQAQQSKRARELTAAIPQPPDAEPNSSKTANIPRTNQALLETQSGMPLLQRAASHDASVLPQTPGSLLGLSAERHTTGWHLRWNSNATVNATSGRLVIADGANHKQLNLDINELRSGSVIYTPMTDDVVLRLEIANPESATPASESIRLIGAGPLLPSQMQTPRAARDDRTGPARAARSDARWAPRTIMNGAAAQQSPVVKSLLRESRSEAASSEARASHAVQQAPNIQPATLVSRADPAYPAIAKENRISGTVEVRFRISQDGKVYGAKPVKGPPILATAAIEALESWRYEPARLHGAPVDSQSSASFDFELN